MFSLYSVVSTAISFLLFLFIKSGLWPTSGFLYFYGTIQIISVYAASQGYSVCTASGDSMSDVSKE